MWDMVGSPRILTLSLLLLLGCPPEAGHGRSAEEVRRREAQEWVNERLSYFRDDRTGICYASWSGYQESSISSVPCDPVIHAGLLR